MRGSLRFGFAVVRGKGSVSSRQETRRRLRPKSGEPARGSVGCHVTVAGSGGEDVFRCNGRTGKKRSSHDWRIGLKDRASGFDVGNQFCVNLRLIGFFS